MEFRLHPDPDMGIYVAESVSSLNAGELAEFAFPLTDSEMSKAYIAWRDEMAI